MRATNFPWAVAVFLLSAFSNARAVDANGIEVVHKDIADVPVFGISDRVEFKLDLDGNGVVDFVFRADEGQFEVHPMGRNRILTSVAETGDLGTYVVPLGSGALVSAELGEDSFGWNSGVDTTADQARATLVSCRDVGCLGPFNGRFAYMAVAFQIDDRMHFGWVRVDLVLSVNGGWITDYAYSSEPDTPLEAGVGQAAPPAQAVRLRALRSLSGEADRLVWPSAEGSYYRLFRRESLRRGDWEPLGILRGTGDRLEVLQRVAGGAKARFYKVEELHFGE